MYLQPAAIITWCQPPDTEADDVIAVDGHFLSPDDVDERREAVSRINQLARSGTRVDLPVRGWKATGRDGVAAQLPVSSTDPAIRPSVAVLVPVGDASLLRAAVRQIVDTALRAGYVAEATSVERALRYEDPRPKGWWSRLVHWVKNLLFGGREQ